MKIGANSKTHINATKLLNQSSKRSILRLLLNKRTIPPSPPSTAVNMRLSDSAMTFYHFNVSFLSCSPSVDDFFPSDLDFTNLFQPDNPMWGGNEVHLQHPKNQESYDT